MILRALVLLLLLLASQALAQYVSPITLCGDTVEIIKNKDYSDYLQCLDTNQGTILYNSTCGTASTEITSIEAKAYCDSFVQSLPITQVNEAIDTTGQSINYMTMFFIGMMVIGLISKIG